MDDSLAGNFVAVCPACGLIVYLYYLNKDTKQYEMISYINEDPNQRQFRCDCGHVFDHSSEESLDILFVTLETLMLMLRNANNKVIFDEIYLNKNALI